jgi:glycosyltransferase involved in cell wall biosynthesis
MPTLHILSCPYNTVHELNRVDPFSIAVVKYIKYMQELGWSCVHYGIVGSRVNCETITCLNKIHQNRDQNIIEYNQNAARKIAERKQPGDFILCFYGNENQPAALANSDLKCVEPSIGYHTNAVFAPYRVFTSYAQMHYYYGKMDMLLKPSWNDAVIYNPINPDEFTYCEEKENYLLYFGRVVEEKGIHVAIQAAEATGKKLVIAGPGDLTSLGYDQTPGHVIMAGICNVEQRKQLMSKAQAILGPTYYLEPFGNMIAEAYMSGTPAITTDWGAFTETVVQGVTGYRCREFRDFINAIHNINQINPADCRSWSMKNCEDREVHLKHDQYLKKISENNFYR